MTDTIESPPPSPCELRSYKCFVRGHEAEGSTIINHISAGKAKSEFFRDLPDGYSYTSCRVKKRGLPFTSDGFKRNAEYRQIPFAYCGMMVQVGGVGFGHIVGHNESANLNVLFFNGKYIGHTLNCHPHSGMVYYDKKGEVIKSYIKETA